MVTDQFVLQFDPSKIVELATRYSYEQDDDAFEAGRNIARGNYTRDNLKVIVRWKSARKIALLDDNTDAQLASSLHAASNAATPEKSAVEALGRLHGVGVPIASAILTMINPEKYTIIDFRALESLGVTKWPNASVRFYLCYLQKCRELAQTHKVTLRTLDRALWQWSKENARQRHECA